MPLLVDPMPSAPAARFGAPDEAHDASYFAASARIRSFRESFSSKSRLGSGVFYLCSRGGFGKQAFGQPSVTDDVVRRFGAAAIEDEGAARMEAAARRDVG